MITQKYINDIAYKIIGCAFEVFNEIGSGHKELAYQKALGISFKSKDLTFKEQVYFPLTFKNEVIGRNYFDFLVDEKIVVEIKSLSKFTKGHYDQVLNYLNTSGLKLALLINFGTEEVKCKRVVNFKAVNPDSQIRKH